MDNDETTNVLIGTPSTIIDGIDGVDQTNGGDLMEPWAYHLAAISLFFIGFFGFSLNLLVIVLMSKDMQLWTPMNIILFNLVCSDFLVSILGNPFTLTAALSHRWIFGQFMCIAYGFFMALLGITSITTLTVLAYERYCLVTYPLSARQISNRGAVISVIFIWIYSFSLTTPPLFGWGAYVNEAANISCSVNWESQSFNATTYIVFLFVFGLVVPVAVISYSYINIILRMRQNSIRLGRKNRAERRITLMVAIMIISFLVAWTPYASFALVEQFGPSDLITPKMAVLPALIAKSSICYNPLIYVGLNTQFKASWKRHICKDSTVVETTVNQVIQTSSPQSLDCTPKLLRQGRDKLFKTKFTSFSWTKSSFEKSEKNKESIRVNNDTTSTAHNEDDTYSNGKHITEYNENCDTNGTTHNNGPGGPIEHELTVFSEGKSILIKSNSYHSNLI